MPSQTKIDPADAGTWPASWWEVVSLEEAARIAGVSEDTLRRHHSHHFIRVSPRRLGMRRGTVLALNSTTKIPA